VGGSWGARGQSTAVDGWRADKAHLQLGGRWEAGGARADKARLQMGGARTKHACSWARAYKARLQGVRGEWWARLQSTPAGEFGVSAGRAYKARLPLGGALTKHAYRWVARLQSTSALSEKIGISRFPSYNNMNR